MTDRELEQRLAPALDPAVTDMTKMTNDSANKRKKPWLRGLIAACLALVLLGAGAGGGMWYQANYAVASIVSLDVNPSIELRVNQKERVLSCAALNEDASAILAETAGQEVTIPAELLLIAAGFSGAEAGPAQAFGLELDEKGRLGDGAYRTSVPKVFSAGDMRRGASLVAIAIAEGRACAKEVDHFLEGYTNL